MHHPPIYWFIPIVLLCAVLACVHILRTAKVTHPMTFFLLLITMLASGFILNIADNVLTSGRAFELYLIYVIIHTVVVMAHIGLIIYLCLKTFYYPFKIEHTEKPNRFR